MSFLLVVKQLKKSNLSCMSRSIFSIVLLASFALLSSCGICCTSKTKAPRLGSLPKFKPLPEAPAEEPAPVIEVTKSAK